MVTKFFTTSADPRRGVGAPLRRYGDDATSYRRDCAPCHKGCHFARNWCLFHSRCKSAGNCVLDRDAAFCRIKKSAHWAPAPNMTILAVERHEAKWIVSLGGGDHAVCPDCGVRSHSRHSSYRRTLRDLPAQGTPVEVLARLNRWRCRNDQCERRIFAERIQGLAAPFARRTTRLAGIVRLFGHSAGGRPSKRLMARLGMHAGQSTILREVKRSAQSNASAAPVKVAGNR